jgi:hypothetical protein
MRRGGWVERMDLKEIAVVVVFTALAVGMFIVMHPPA